MSNELELLFTGLFIIFILYVPLLLMELQVKRIRKYEQEEKRKKEMSSVLDKQIKGNKNFLRGE